jgi:hypothetical protein
MMRVKDSSTEFPCRPVLALESATLAELIDLVLGAALGQRVLQQVGSEPANSARFSARLRLFLNAATAEVLGLTGKRAKLEFFD